MRAVIQRVCEAEVTIKKERISRIERGILVLVGFTNTDTEENLRWMAQKISSLRLFEDDAGKMNRTLEEIGGEILVVSQFTLYGDCRKGRRPSFDKSASPEKAEILYDKFIDILKTVAPCRIAAGVFREYMHVSLVNDGPVTLIVERENDS
jgi:D-tyrosyl-tRNA(Tyr) deacylase